MDKNRNRGAKPRFLQSKKIMKKCEELRILEFEKREKMGSTRKIKGN